MQICFITVALLWLNEIKNITTLSSGLEPLNKYEQQTIHVLHIYNEYQYLIMKCSYVS